MATPIVIEFKKRASSIAAYISPEDGAHLNMSASNSMRKNCPSLSNARWHGHRFSVDVEELALLCKLEDLEISKVLNPDCNLIYYCVVPSYSTTTGFEPLCDVAYSFTHLPSKEDIMAAENLEGSIVVVSTKLSKRGRVLHYPVFETPLWTDPFDSCGEEDLSFLANIDQEDAILLHVALTISKARHAFLKDKQSVQRISSLIGKLSVLKSSNDYFDKTNFYELIRVVSAMDRMYLKFTDSEVNELLSYAQQPGMTNDKFAMRLFKSMEQAMHMEGDIFLVERLYKK